MSELVRIRRIVLVAHDNQGSASLFEDVVSAYPDVQFLLILGTGLYYKRSFLGSVIKLLREASWIFVAVRFIELLHYRMRRRTLARMAAARGIPVVYVRDINAPESISVLRDFAPDVLVSLFTMLIYRAPALAVPRLGAITSHPSILPTYRGLEVFFWALANGEKKTGASVFFIEPKIDAGRVFEQEEVDIAPDETVASLYSKITVLCGRLLVKGIRDLDADTLTHFAPCGEDSYFPMPTRAAYRRFRDRGGRFFRARRG